MSDTLESRALWTTSDLLCGAFALAMLVCSASLLWKADAGVVRTFHQLGATPVTVFDRQGGEEPLATVVIAHGFAGSQQLMQSFAVAVARQGYRAVSFDFFGHGRNLEPLTGDVTQIEGATQRLVGQTQAVMDFAEALPGGSERLTLLGHSMATDIIVRVAAQDARVDATIAVSLFSPAVTATTPRNLLIIDGALEGMLKTEALRILSLNESDPKAGETYGQFALGTARRAVFAPSVEHVGVLFSQTSLHAAIAWLDEVYGRQGTITIRGRGLAVLLLLVGLGLLGRPLARLLPRLSHLPRGAGVGWRPLLVAGIVPAIATPLLLMNFPTDFLEVLVGGYLAVHFGVYGVLTAVCVFVLKRWGPWASESKRPGSGYPETAPPAAQGPQVRWFGILIPLLATAYTAGLFGLVLDRYVTSFVVTVPRLPLVGWMLLGTLCFFLADEWLTRGAGTPRGARWYSHLCFLVSIGIAVALSFDALFFLLIIAAIIVLYFLVYGLFSSWIYRATGHPAVGAVANAVAFAWALTVVFPMLAGGS